METNLIALVGMVALASHADEAPPPPFTLSGVRWRGAEFGKGLAV
jgi:hypothetical protein